MFRYFVCNSQNSVATKISQQQKTHKERTIFGMWLAIPMRVLCTLINLPRFITQPPLTSQYNQSFFGISRLFYYSFLFFGISFNNVEFVMVTFLGDVPLSIIFARNLAKAVSFGGLIFSGSNLIIF